MLHFTIVMLLALARHFKLCTLFSMHFCYFWLTFCYFQILVSILQLLDEYVLPLAFSCCNRMTVISLCSVKDNEGLLTICYCQQAFFICSAVVRFRSQQQFSLFLAFSQTFNQLYIISNHFKLLLATLQLLLAYYFH